MVDQDPHYGNPKYGYFHDDGNWEWHSHQPSETEEEEEFVPDTPDQRNETPSPPPVETESDSCAEEEQPVAQQAPAGPVVIDLTLDD